VLFLSDVPSDFVSSDKLDDTAGFALVVTLSKAKGLFSSSDMPDTALDIESTHYVSGKKKELLLDKILVDFQLLNPNEKTCSFQQVKQELSEKYNIKTRTISNFFTRELKALKLIGGNRNRQIVLNSKK
tara:strand:+ start:384 stop:770 length:387 start_codon:yes stop_codon:yes gene_type:complete